MKVIKNHFTRMQKFTGAILCIAFFIASGCSKSELSEQSSVITYPETGKYGPNILAVGFLEAKKTEGDRPVEYSVRALLPAGNSSLKIVIKSAKPVSYVCRNHLPDSPCDAKFDEWHEMCPQCGGTNMQKINDRFIGLYQGNDVNWVISTVDSQLSFTYVDELVHKDGKVADATVSLDDDCIIEYYENGAKEPTRVKEIKVID